MSHATLRFVKSLIALAAIAFLAGCPGGSGNLNTSGNANSTSTEGTKGAFFLSYDQQHDPSKDVDPSLEKIALVWEGARQLGPGESKATEDTFKASDNPEVHSADPWKSSPTMAPNLNAGIWDISLTVQGGPAMVCNSIKLDAGANKSLTFVLDKDGKFSGCTN